MTRKSHTIPMQEQTPRAGLPEHRDATSNDAGAMTHEQLLDALRAIDGLVDVGHDPPNFHFRSRPFLHFHTHDDGIYADVRFGNGDFEPIWAATPQERQELLARVADHIEGLQLLKKGRPARSRGDRER